MIHHSLKIKTRPDTDFRLVLVDDFWAVFSIGKFAYSSEKQNLFKSLTIEKKALMRLLISMNLPLCFILAL